MNVHYCSPVEWWETRQRFHHVAHGLSDRHRFHVFFPRSHKRILKERGLGALLSPFSRETEGAVTLFGVPTIPFYRAFPPLIPVNWEFSNRLMARIARAQPEAVDILWLTHPAQAGLEERIPHRRLVYECVDDYALFWGDAATRQRVIHLEETLARKADLVVATSQRLYERMQAWNPRTAWVGNGAEVDYFREVRTQAFELPEELHGRTGPFVGFYGALGDWVDLDLVVKAAKAYPHVTFLLIGPAFTDVSPVRDLPNVVLTGLVSYERLRPFLAHIPLWILPFKRNALTEAVDPVKIYEYLAAGRKVVSTFLPELTPWRDYLSLTESQEAFLEALAEALQAPIHVPEALDALLEARSWKTLCDRLHAELIRLDAPHVPDEKEPA